MTALDNGVAGWLLFLLVAGYLATDFWRILGVFAALKVDENGEIFRWVRAVSTALVAALIARLVLFPPGALGETSLLLRGGAFLVGCATFLFIRRNMLIGILAAESVLIAGLWLGL